MIKFLNPSLSLQKKILLHFFIFQALEKSIQGGELFQTIVNNPMSIFMTHMPNYGFDRLAPYTFESVVKMIKCWTNLDLVTKPPKELAEIYFKDLFPEDKDVIWGVCIFKNVNPI